MNGTRLNIAYISQMGAFATKARDCGPACVLMFVHSLTSHRHTTVDDVSRLIPKFWDGRQTSTDLQDNIRAAAAFGVNLAYHVDVTAEVIEQKLDNGQGMIALVNYERLPERYITHMTIGGHFIVLHGYDEDFYYYDDVNYPYAADGNHPGENKRIRKADLFRAMQGSVIRDFSRSNQVLILTDAQLTRFHGDMEIGAMAVAKSSTIPDSFLEQSHTLWGTVEKREEDPVANACVRVRGVYPQLAHIPGAVIAPAPGVLAWDFLVMGYSGDVTQAYQELVDPAISWNDFIAKVGELNLHLIDDGYQLDEAKVYTFPRLAVAYDWSGISTPVVADTTVEELWRLQVQSKQIPLGYEEFRARFLTLNRLSESTATLKTRKQYRIPERVEGGWVVAWTKQVSGIDGTFDEVYNRHVAPVVPTLRRDEFHTQVVKHNPTLQTTPFFQPTMTYLLPEREAESYVYLSTWTTSEGEYQLDYLPAGSYTLEVAGAGILPRSETLSLIASAAQDITVSVKGATSRGANAKGKAPAGFITTGTGANTGRFMLDGNVFQFVGVNTRGFLHWNEERYHHSGATQREHLRRLAQEFKGKVIRLFLPYDRDDHSLKTHEIGTRLEHVLNMLNEFGLYTIVAFTDVHDDMRSIVPGDLKYYTLQRHVKMLDLPWYQIGYQENYLPFVKAMVKRFAHRKEIMAWEIGNELRAMSGTHGIHPAIMKSFMKTVIQTIRELDGNHMIATGSINSENMGVAPAFAQDFYKDLAIDFLVAHIYPDHKDKTELERAEREAQLAKQLNKPFIIEEIGFYLASGDRSVKVRDALDKWFSPNSAADGVLQWGYLGVPDNEDGDTKSGLMMNKHQDFDAVTHEYMNV